MGRVCSKDPVVDRSVPDVAHVVGGVGGLHLVGGTASTTSTSASYLTSNWPSPAQKNATRTRVAEVARTREQRPPNSLDSDENLKPWLRLFCCNVQICRKLCILLLTFRFKTASHVFANTPKKYLCGYNFGNTCLAKESKAYFEFAESLPTSATLTRTQPEVPSQTPIALA